MKKKTVTINLFWVFCVIAIIATVAWNINCFKNTKEIRTAVNNYKNLLETVDLDNYSAAIDQISNYNGEEKPVFDSILKSYKDKISYLKGLESDKSEILVTETLALRNAMKEDIGEFAIYDAWEITYWEVPLWVDVFIFIVMFGLIALEIDCGFELYLHIPVLTGKEKSVDC